jgi:hypothetical protein
VRRLVNMAGVTSNAEEGAPTLSRKWARDEWAAGSFTRVNVAVAVGGRQVIGVRVASTTNAAAPLLAKFKMPLGAPYSDLLGAVYHRSRADAMKEYGLAYVDGDGDTMELNSEAQHTDFVEAARVAHNKVRASRGGRAP